MLGIVLLFERSLSTTHVKLLLFFYKDVDICMQLRIHCNTARLPEVWCTGCSPVAMLLPTCMLLALSVFLRRTVVSPRSQQLVLRSVFCQQQ